MEAMKTTLTITAVLATIVAIPFFLHKRRARLRLLRAESGVRPHEEERRYDVFDFTN
jgi:hypothetical protein